MGEDQGERPNLVGGESLQIEVLDDEDPVVDVGILRHGETAAVDPPVGPVHSSRCHSPVRAMRRRASHPARSHPAPARRRGISRRLVPVPPPAGARTAPRHPGGRVDPGTVLRGDHTTRTEPVDVDQPAGRDDLRHGLHAEVPDAGGARELGDAEPAVAPVIHLKVRERVEMGAQLHRPGHELGDPVDPVLPHPAVRIRVMRGGDECLLEVATREHGNVLVEHVTQVVDPAETDLREG